MTYNVVTALLPYHFNNLVRRKPPTSILYIFDFLVACHNIDPKLAADSELEFEEICLSFGQDNLPKTTPIPQGTSGELRTLIEIKDKLGKLWAMFPYVANLIKSSSLSSAFYQIETPLASLLSHMEVSGIRFFPSRLEAFETQLEKCCNDLAEKAKTMTKNPHVSSPPYPHPKPDNKPGPQIHPRNQLTPPPPLPWTQVQHCVPAAGGPPAVRELEADRAGHEGLRHEERQEEDRPTIDERGE